MDTHHEIRDSEILASHFDSRLERSIASLDPYGPMWTSLEQTILDSDDELVGNRTAVLQKNRCLAASSCNEGFEDDLDWSQDSSSHSGVDFVVQASSPPLVHPSPRIDPMTCHQTSSQDYEDYLLMMLPDTDTPNGYMGVDRCHSDSICPRSSTPLLPIECPHDEHPDPRDSDGDMSLVLDEQMVLDDVFMDEDGPENSENLMGDWTGDSDEDFIFTFADDM